MNVTQEEHNDLARNEKICGECDGKRLLATSLFKALRCPVCLGRGKYSYTPKGDRVAWDAKRKEWRST